MLRIRQFQAIVFAVLMACWMGQSCPAFGQSSGSLASASLVDLAEQQQWEKLVAKLKGIPASQSLDDLNNEVQPDGMTALHWASFHGNDSVVSQLLERNCDVDAATIYNVTPLSLACEYGHEDVANALLSHASKPELEAKRMGGERPLMLAARNGNSKIVKQLLEDGADVNAQEVKGQDALMWAASAGNTESVKLLVEAGADIKRKTKQGFNALMFATRAGHIETAMELLELGFDVNEVMEPARTSGRNPRKGMSPLILAVENGHFELALALVKKGADPNDQRSGYAPLHAISWVRKTSIGDNPAGDPPPRTTGSVNSLEFVRQLIKLGGDVNLKCTRKGKSKEAVMRATGATPFLFAAETADLPLMKLLLELGADPKTTNADETTALIAAAGIGVTAVGEEPGTEDEVEQAIRLLLELGLDIDAVDKKGETVMHGAAYRSYPSTVALLAELGADPEVWNQKNKYGHTPHAIANGKRPGSFKPSPETIAALDASLK